MQWQKEDMRMSARKANTENSKAEPARKRLAKKSGRPSVVSDKVLRKLEEAFGNGATDSEACGLAGISRSTLYLYCTHNQEFSDRKETLKSMPTYHAKVSILKAIKADPKVAMDYLERVDKSFAKSPPPDSKGVQVNVQNNVSPCETPEGQQALRVLHAIFTGKALPGAE